MVTPPARRVGLSYRDSPGRLLKSAKPSTEATTTTAAAAATMAAPRPESKARGGRPQLKVPDPVPVPEDIFAPPLASSDSEGDDMAASTAADLESSRQPQPLADSSDSDGPPRGAIPATSFTSSSQKKGERQGRRTKNQGTTAASPPAGEAEESQQRAGKRKRQSDAASDKSKAKKKNTPAEPDSCAPPPGSGSHLTNGHGFTRQAKVKATFGKKKMPGSQERRKSRGETASANFRPPPEFDNDTPRKSSKFIVPDDNAFSSPIKNGLTLRRDYDSDTDGDAAAFSQPRSTTGDAGFAGKSKPRGKRKENSLRPNKKHSTGKKERQEPPRSPSPPPAKFVLPAQLSDFKLPQTTATTTTITTITTGSDASDDGLGDASSSDLSSLGSLFPDKDGEQDGKALCPWCGAMVDTKQLQDFSKGRRLNVRMQTKFCEAHKKKSAMATWESRSYPQVKWARLEKRFKNHQDRLLGIINGEEESYYRAALADKIELGQARSMKKEENLNPGYYGPRGFNMMCDYLVSEFGDMLKKKAIHDRVIAGRGSAAFIQSVLVAELGVQLIMEDMRVSSEEARGILEESKALGELVHAEV